MTSYPPAQCCTVGVRHEGTPTGTSIKIGNIEAYVAQPTGSKIHKESAILICPDVISIWQNSKLIADQFAENGYYTLIVDLFNGDPIPLNRPPGFVFKTWQENGSTGDNPHTYQYIDPIVESGIKYLKEQGFKRIGGVGYCFGAKYIARFSAKRKGIDVGYYAHPSFVEEEELRAITGPLSISAAEMDVIFPAERRHKSEEILKETKQPYQINLFSGVEHGYAIRCDLSVKIQRYAKEQAFLQAVNWFKEWL